MYGQEPEIRIERQGPSVVLNFNYNIRTDIMLLLSNKITSANLQGPVK